MPWQKPDPAAEIGKLKREVEELSRIVRRGKPPANMRDLADGSLSKASDGHVPVYQAATGTWKPGSAGALPFMQVRFDTSQTIPTGAWTAVTFNAGNTYGEGPTFNLVGNTVALLQAGVVDINLWATFTANATGVRGARVIRGSFNRGFYVPAAGASPFETVVSVAAMDQVFLAAVGTSYTVEVYQNSGGNLTLLNGFLELAQFKNWS